MNEVSLQENPLDENQVDYQQGSDQNLDREILQEIDQNQNDVFTNENIYSQSVSSKNFSK